MSTVRTRWVGEQVRSALDAESDATRLLVMAKSLGTLASTVAADRRIDAIWMTPLFVSAADSIRAIRQNAATGARQLLIGGGVDPEWHPEEARMLGCDVAEFADATHFLHVPGDAVRSAQVQVDVTRAVDAFLTLLDRDG